jgi:hypothetical protein
MPPDRHVDQTSIHPRGMKNLAAVGKIFRRANPLQRRGRQPYQSFPRWHGDCFHLALPRKGVSMTTSIANAGSYLRFAQAPPSRTTLTTADALPVAEAEASTAAGNAKPGIPGSPLKALDVSDLRTISKDNPELRDVMATAWLKIQALNSTKPRQTTATNYTPAQLDAAFEAIMMAAQQNASGSRSTGYSTQRESSGGHTDFTA